MTGFEQLERMQMVKAMEFIVRCINNEEITERWLLNGVADGEIDMGNVSIQAKDAEVLSYYIQKKNFSELMDLFLKLMEEARKDGGLYCGGVVSDGQ